MILIGLDGYDFEREEPVRAHGVAQGGIMVAVPGDRALRLWTAGAVGADFLACSVVAANGTHHLMGRVRLHRGPGLDSRDDKFPIHVAVSAAVDQERVLGLARSLCARLLADFGLGTLLTEAELQGGPEAVMEAVERLALGSSDWQARFEDHELRPGSGVQGDGGECGEGLG